MQNQLKQRMFMFIPDTWSYPKIIDMSLLSQHNLTKQLVVSAESVQHLKRCALKLFANLFAHSLLRDSVRSEENTNLSHRGEVVLYVQNFLDVIVHLVPLGRVW